MQVSKKCRAALTKKKKKVEGSVLLPFLEAIKDVKRSLEGTISTELQCQVLFVPRAKETRAHTHTKKTKTKNKKQNRKGAILIN